ncbi:hypothetical protein LguiA_008511 [Lonicera macranthoides]
MNDASLYPNSGEMFKMHLRKNEESANKFTSITDENKSDAIIIDDKIAVPKNSNLSDKSFGLFRKYLCTNAQNNFGKTNYKESEAIRRKAPTGPLVPLNSSDSFRRPSCLERVLFPGIKDDLKLPNLTGEKSSTAQLTIFYAGEISVYDNISVEKAQAIMLIAGGNASSAPMVKNVTKVGIARPSNLPSTCMLQAEFPLARKHSLQRFFEKRRDRKINRSPYSPPTRT